MDTIYDYLKADHKKVDNLFTQFEKAPTKEGKQDYVNMIIQELLIHAESEEETFYKALLKYNKAEDEVLHGEEEHLHIRNKISEIVSFTEATPLWEKSVHELKKLVEHHVKEEEGKIFKQAKKVFSDEEAFVIREQMHDLKEKILTKLDSSAL